MKANDAEEILAATEELVHELMDRNALAPEQMVSCIFTLLRTTSTPSFPRSPPAGSG